jgi:hypothetical protein
MKQLAICIALAACIGIAANQPAPKATASPAPIDHSAELAALQAENADLKESLRVAVLATTPSHAESEPLEESPAPLVAMTPGPRTQPAAYIAAPRPVQSCAGGVCMPAAQGPRYQYQSRSSQPRRFVGRLFGRR